MFSVINTVEVVSAAFSSATHSVKGRGRNDTNSLSRVQQANIMEIHHRGVLSHPVVIYEFEPAFSSTLRALPTRLTPIGARQRSPRKDDSTCAVNKQTHLHLS
jgi:hypothetical protein